MAAIARLDYPLLTRMATESSAVVRIAQLAQERRLGLAAEVSQETAIVRLASPRPALWPWLGAAIAVLIAVGVATSWRAQSIGPQPVVAPLVSDVVALPLPEPSAVAVVTPLEARVDQDRPGDGPSIAAPTAVVAHAQRAGWGILQLGSKPPCEILINGRNTGLETPQRKIRLRPGRHTVGLRNRDVGIDERFRVRIRDGQTTKVIRDMTDRL